MTKKVRLILFLILGLLFTVTAPLVVFYSLGWRINWQEKKIVQPGIFYFKVQPKNAEIYLNGKLKKRTNFLSGSAIIENLAPKTYQVEIKKQGYHTWKKNLKIKKGKATEAKNIILFPKKISFKKIENKNEYLDLFNEKDEAEKEIKKIKEKTTSQEMLEKIKEISGSHRLKLSPDAKKIAYFDEHEIGILFLKEKFEQLNKKPMDQIFLNRFSQKIKNLFWLNNNYLIFNIEDEIKILETDERDRLNCITLDEKFPNSKIFWDYKKKTLYLLSGEKNLYISNKII